MITFTDRAREAVLGFMGEDEQALEALRIRENPGGLGATRFELALVSRDELGDGDVEHDLGDFKVFVESNAVESLDGAVVDFVERVNESGFEVKTAHANGADAMDPDEMAEKVRAVLDERVNPAVAAHGGAIVLKAVEGNDVFIEMTGGCQGCAMSRMTLRQGVERMLRDVIPQIGNVHDATDHQSGSNPYFAQ